MMTFVERRRSRTSLRACIRGHAGKQGAAKKEGKSQKAAHLSAYFPRIALSSHQLVIETFGCVIATRRGAGVPTRAVSAPREPNLSPVESTGSG